MLLLAWKEDGAETVEDECGEEVGGVGGGDGDEGFGEEGMVRGGRGDETWGLGRWMRLVVWLVGMMWIRDRWVITIMVRIDV